MRKAEDILDKCNRPFKNTIRMGDEHVNSEAAIRAIKQAQIEAIEETVKECAESNMYLKERNKKYVLSVADQLKSKL